MATYRQRNDKWQVQVRRKSGFYRSATFTTKRDAERWSIEVEREAERSDAGLTSAVRLDEPLVDLIARYRATILPLKRCSHKEGYILSALAAEAFSSLPASEIRPELIAKYRDRRLSEVTPSTLIRSLGVLSHVFETARREWGYDWLTNPTRSVRKPHPNTARSRRLEGAEEAALMVALRRSRNAQIVPISQFALETAMRQGEILGLQWGHVDTARRLAFLPITKNGRSRHVPLTGRALEILGSQRSPEHERPFPSTPSALQQAWRRSVRTASIENLHFHDLRHEAISRLFERGLSLPEVGLISGHTDPRQLLRYTHLRAQEIAEKFEKQEALGAGV
jgi:integrase